VARRWLWGLLLGVVGVFLVGCGSTEPSPPGRGLPDAAAALSECERTVAEAAWTEALAACEQARALVPTPPALADRLAQVYLAYGRAALSSGDVAGALTWFERAREQRPDLSEVASEYALALAYRAGEIALANANWPEAVAKFEAVYTADPLYLAWLPERAPRQRLAEAHVGWGRALLAEHALDDAERHCLQARELAPTFPAVGECLTAIAVARTPTPTPTRTPAPTRPIPLRPTVRPTPRPPSLATPAPTALPAPASPAPTSPTALPPRGPAAPVFTGRPATPVSGP